MFDYKPLAATMKAHNEGTKDVARLLNMDLEDMKDKLNHNKFLSMPQLHKLCTHYECGPEAIMSWSPDGDLIKLDWSKVAAFGKPLTTLSVECGMSWGALSNTSKGSGRVKADNAKKIAEVLGCTVEDLI